MPGLLDIVITGVGVVSPIGIGHDAFWTALREQRSGVRMVESLDGTPWPVRFGAPLVDFDPKQYVRPRKSLKVMCREIQTGFAAATMAMEHAGLAAEQMDPERTGVLFGSEMLYSDPDELADSFRACLVDGQFDPGRWDLGLAKMYPLWMLRYLPNMTACHVGIAHDARGPNNTICVGEASGLLAMIEAADVIRRGDADVMIVGGSGSRLSLTPMMYRGDIDHSHRADEPERASRPFDADRDGVINGEGAGVLVLESREHATRRGAEILCRVAGQGRSYDASRDQPPERIEAAIRQAVQTADLQAADISHVNAHGCSVPRDDAREAQALAATLGDVPVTALKSFFGSLGAGGGAVEAVGGVLSILHQQVPVTLNYETPDPDCPVNVIHREPLTTPQDAVLLLNRSGTGQVAAVVLTRN